jgi:pilus assembly protein CpaB
LSARRTVILIVAIALGTVAALSSVLYLNSVQSRANGNAKLIRVYKVTQVIPKGTTGDDAISHNDIVASSIPKKFYPVTAVTDLDEIKGLIAPVELDPGQVLVSDQFVEPSVANTSFSTTNVPAGQVAVTLSFGSTQAVAGLIVPGDKVDIIGSFSTGSSGSNSSGTTNYEHFIYQNVNVIAIGQTAAPTAGNSTAPTNPGSSLFTFAVPPVAAERLLLADQQDALTLALVPPDNTPVPIAPVQGSDVDNPGALTPYGT